LEVRLDDGDPVLVPQTVSPDSDYFWLDRVSALPVHLTPGEHVLRYRYVGGEDGAENPGVAKVDAFYVQPAVARRLFVHPDGRRFFLTYATLTGAITWEELPPA
ncbi:MAG: hypothetical protein JW910_13370, partial [Anaerolineae bacterium]|nr:hypothetical protein [Anaerolineae bacterium]